MIKSKRLVAHAQIGYVKVAAKQIKLSGQVTRNDRCSVHEW